MSERDLRRDWAGRRRRIKAVLQENLDRIGQAVVVAAPLVRRSARTGVWLTSFDDARQGIGRDRFGARRSAHQGRSTIAGAGIRHGNLAADGVLADPKDLTDQLRG